MRPPEWIQCALNLSLPEWRKSENQHLTGGSLDLVYCRFLSGDCFNCWGSLGASLEQVPCARLGFSWLFFFVFYMLVLFWNLQGPKIVARKQSKRIRCGLCTNKRTMSEMLNNKKGDRVKMMMFCTALNCCSSCSSNNWELLDSTVAVVLLHPLVRWNWCIMAALLAKDRWDQSETWLKVLAPRLCVPGVTLMLVSPLL